MNPKTGSIEKKLDFCEETWYPCLDYQQKGGDRDAEKAAVRVKIRRGTRQARPPRAREADPGTPGKDASETTTETPKAFLTTSSFVIS